MERYFSKRTSNLFQTKNDNIVIAYRSGMPVLAPEFISEIISYWHSFKENKSDLIFIHTDDALTLLSSLIAAIACEAKIVIPGSLTNYLKELIEKSLHEERGQAYQSYLVDKKSDFAQDFSSIQQEFLADLSKALVDTSNVEIILTTSGSSAQPVPIKKTLQQLESEVSTHVNLWKINKLNAIVAGSCSHQHIYGLIFRVLLPFVSEVTFESEPQLLPALNRKSVFISSPAVLKRLTHEQKMQVLETASLVFSSGGNLDRKYADGFGAKLIEVYGSTETGGIAYRQPDIEQFWKPLPGVDCSIGDNNCLLVESNFVSALGSQAFQTADEINFNDDQSFELLGRADRIVKVEEKRISLSAIEEVLLQLSLVRDCIVTTFEQKDRDRKFLAVLLELSSEGYDFLWNKSRQELLELFNHHIRERLGLAISIRFWRILEKLPRDLQGKITREKISSIVDSRVDLPKQVVKASAGNRINLSLTLADEISYCEGHFDKMAVVPAYIQIDWVLEFSRKFFGVGMFVEKSSSLKFNSLIIPGMQLELELNFNPDKNQLDFKFFDNEIKFSSGALKLRRINDEPGHG